MRNLLTLCEIYVSSGALLAAPINVPHLFNHIIFGPSVFGSVAIFSHLSPRHTHFSPRAFVCYYAGKFPRLFISWWFSFIRLPARRVCTVWNYHAFWYYTNCQASTVHLPCVFTSFSWQIQSDDDDDASPASMWYAGTCSQNVGIFSSTVNSVV